MKLVYLQKGQTLESCNHPCKRSDTSGIGEANPPVSLGSHVITQYVLKVACQKLRKNTRAPPKRQRHVAGTNPEHSEQTSFLATLIVQCACNQQAATSYGCQHSLAGCKAMLLSEDVEKGRKNNLARFINFLTIGSGARGEVGAHAPL